MSLSQLGIIEARRKLLEGELTCQELVEFYLDRIDQFSDLNAFISVFAEQARRAAADIDARVKSGQAGKLAGAVIAVKDNINCKESLTTCGSRILHNYVSPYDATVIQKLQAADAIVIGKTNMDEFAMGSSNENSYFGACKNPHDSTRVPGGSSGGSCVAVAADLAGAALGSDTGGSIRQPASFCGVVGLKPTYGRVSRYGLAAFASSFDQIGPIGKNVEDSAVLLEVIAGHDPRDCTSSKNPLQQFVTGASEPDVAGLRVGIPAEYFDSGLDDEVEAAIRKAAEQLSSQGAEVVETSLPHTRYAVAAYYVLTTAEASSNLSRYDGARYGFRAEESFDLDEMYVHSRSQGFGAEVKRRIMLGTYVLSAGYYDAYYRKGQQVRQLIRKDFEEAFVNCDCLLTPTCPTTAFRLNERLDDPLTMYLSDVYTVSVNLAGLPALSVPCGRDHQELPIGVQVIGKSFDEATVLRVGSAIERLQG